MGYNPIYLIYKWVVILLLTIDPNFLGHPSRRSIIGVTADDFASGLHLGPPATNRWKRRRSPPAKHAPFEHRRGHVRHPLSSFNAQRRGIDRATSDLDVCPVCTDWHTGKVCNRLGGVEYAKRMHWDERFGIIIIIIIIMIILRKSSPKCQTCASYSKELGKPMVNFTWKLRWWKNSAPPGMYKTMWIMGWTTNLKWFPRRISEPSTVWVSPNFLSPWMRWSKLGLPIMVSDIHFETTMSQCRNLRKPASFLHEMRGFCSGTLQDPSIWELPAFPEADGLYLQTLGLATRGWSHTTRFPSTSLHWSNHSDPKHDLPWPQKRYLRKGHPLISATTRLVRYDNLARLNVSKPGDFRFHCSTYLGFRFAGGWWNSNCLQQITPWIYPSASSGSSVVISWSPSLHVALFAWWRKMADGGVWRWMTSHISPVFLCAEGIGQGL